MSEGLSEGRFMEANLPRVEDGNLGGGGDGEEDGGTGTIQSILRESGHPGVAIFHVVFKVGALVSYLTLGWFVKSFVIQFVVTVTLLAFDFWTVKNVSGRLLVGLRWWSDVTEDGGTQWRFETNENPDALNRTDGRIFWWMLYITPVVWVLLGVVALIKFHFNWLMVVVIALVLNMANMVGYFKCSKAAQDQMRSLVNRTVLQTAMGRLWG